MEQSTKEWLSKRFGIPEDDVIWYNAGCCYSRVGVKSRESAEKVNNTVNRETVNGGMLDGMPLGGISEYKDEKTGKIQYDVTC
jgi:hypothetical protein